MTESRALAAILEEAERIHGEVTRRTDGVDAEWPAFYAWWLIEWSDLPDVLELRPSRSRLVAELIRLDREYRSEAREESWSSYYADGLRAVDWNA
jgi:hypothetical protein